MFGIYHCHRWQCVIFRISKYVCWESTTVIDDNVSCLQAVNTYGGNLPLSLMAMCHAYMFTSSKYVCWESTTVIYGNGSCLQCLIITFHGLLTGIITFHMV